MKKRNISSLGIISDVHGDYESVCEAIERLRYCDEIIHLGDIVEDEIESNKIVDLLIKNNISGVQGNHDTLYNQISFNLNEKTKDYISSLPLELDINDLFLIHDNPLSKKKDEGLWHYGGYIKTEYTAGRVFKEDNHKIIIVGHSHRAIQYSFKDNKVKEINDSKIRLDPDCRYILNPGCVSTQSYEDPSVGIYDFKHNTFSVIRL